MRLIRTFLIGIVFTIILLIIMSIIYQSIHLFMIAVIISSPFLMILLLFAFCLICVSIFNEESLEEWHKKDDEYWESRLL